jgi:hypothetical protein
LGLALPLDPICSSLARPPDPRPKFVGFGIAARLKSLGSGIIVKFKRLKTFSILLIYFWHLKKIDINLLRTAVQYISYKLKISQYLFITISWIRCKIISHPCLPMSTLCRGVELFFFFLCVKIMFSFHKHVLKENIIRVINLTELNKLALIQFDEIK